MKLKITFSQIFLLLGAYFGLSSLYSETINLGNYYSSYSGLYTTVKTPLLSFVPQNAAPANAAGAVYYDSSQDKLVLFNGTAWVSPFAGADPCWNGSGGNTYCSTSHGGKGSLVAVGTDPTAEVSDPSFLQVMGDVHVSGNLYHEGIGTQGATPKYKITSPGCSGAGSATANSTCTTDIASWNFCGWGQNMYYTCGRDYSWQCSPVQCANTWIGF